MSDVSAEPVCSCAHFCTLLHTRPRVQRAPGIPCALALEGKENSEQASGRWSRENAKLRLALDRHSPRTPATPRKTASPYERSSARQKAIKQTRRRKTAGRGGNIVHSLLR